MHANWCLVMTNNFIFMEQLIDDARFHLALSAMFISIVNILTKKANILFFKNFNTFFLNYCVSVISICLITFIIVCNFVEFFYLNFTVQFIFV